MLTAGDALASTCRSAGIRKATYDNEPSMARWVRATTTVRQRELDDKNHRSKTRAADFSSGRAMLQDAITRKL